MKILLTVLGVLTVCFGAAFAIAIYRIKRLTSAFTKLYIAQTTLESFLAERSENSNIDKSEEEVHKENFIKFLSESRDWAFQYIEDVQAGLDKFMKSVEPSIDSYQKLEIPPSMMSPNDVIIVNFIKEFNELKNLMPTEDINDRR